MKRIQTFFGLGVVLILVLGFVWASQQENTYTAENTATSTDEVIIEMPVLEEDVIERAKTELDRINQELDEREQELLEQRQHIDTELDRIRETRLGF
jgi:hypothetical protein